VREHLLEMFSQRLPPRDNLKTGSNPYSWVPTLCVGLSPEWKSSRDYLAYLPAPSSNTLSLALPNKHTGIGCSTKSITVYTSSASYDVTKPVKTIFMYFGTVYRRSYQRVASDGPHIKKLIIVHIAEWTVRAQSRAVTATNYSQCSCGPLSVRW